MIPSIRAEFRKLLTIRSTYILIFLGVAMILLFAFYGDGLKYSGPTDNTGHLESNIKNAVVALSLFTALPGVLLLTHEYRYNTIMYTLTASNSRAKTLLAKIIAVSTFAVLLTLLFATLSPLLAALGLRIQGMALSEQVFHFKDLWWRVLLYGWGYAMYGLILATIIRNQIGAIVALFLTQATIEPLLGIVLKENRVYLPFNAINSVLSSGGQPESEVVLSAAKAATVVLIYILVGWIVSLVLFLRRDAN